MKYLFFALRPTQWIKNLFIFLPIIFGKKMFTFPANLKTVVGFFIFSMTAATVYLVNDIIDAEKDRIHPTKRLRPIASGKISIPQAATTACILSAMSVGCSFMLNIYFGWIVIAYIALNLLYSKILKKLVIIDVFSVSGFFLLRIMSGSVIAEVKLSHWIIIMTALLALFLAFNKRRQEISILDKKTPAHSHVLLKYNLYFIDQMIAVLTSSVVIVYMLYTIDARTVGEFGNSHLMYTIPFVYYGIFRYLYLIHKVRSHGDPTRILISDRLMQVNLALWLSVCVAIIYFGF